MQSYNHRGQVRTTESSGWVLFDAVGQVRNTGPPVEYGPHELLLVRQLLSWWKHSLQEGKGKEVVSNGIDGTGSGVDGHLNGNRHIVKVKSKNKAKRGGKKVNLNR